MKRDEGTDSRGGEKKAGLHFRKPTAATVVAPSSRAPFADGLDARTVPRVKLTPSSGAPSDPGYHELPPPPPPADDPYGGHVIDNRYVVETLLARGGMGLVYQCRHRIIGKKVAIKIIRTDITLMPEAPRRFQLEAKAASAIGNEHIIDISDFGILPDGASYLVMELLDGMPLSDVIDGPGPLPTQRILAIARQVAEGLGAAHNAGIVHRDLKPDNIFLVRRKDGDFVKILDFGIAKMSVPEGVKLTQAGAIVGTPHYMAPEQAAGDRVDHRGDIYSLGVIMYELVSGRVPFDGQHCLAVLTKHVQEPPPPFGSLTPVPNVPYELEAIIQRCLAKHPEERYSSMEELIEALDRVRGARPRPIHSDVAFRATAPTPPTSARPPSPPPASSKPEGKLPKSSRPSSVISVPAAPGRSLMAQPKRSPARWIFLGASVLGLSLASLWRMSTLGGNDAVSLAAPAAALPPVDDALPMPAAPPNTLAALNSPEPASNAPGQPLPSAPQAADSAPPELSPLPIAPATPQPQRENLGTLPTIVELAPGKSVEIEARTRLSLRLDSETGGMPIATAVLERKARPRNKTKPLPAPPEPAPPAPTRASSDLMNPWPERLRSQ
jgi:serine/threonine protein kinase